MANMPMPVPDSSSANISPKRQRLIRIPYRERLLSLYALPEVEHYRIDQEVNWYLQHPATLAIIQQRAEPYLHHILDEIEAKNIPGELALLPVVESAFLPDAYSHADASGLWQFVPSTGEEYGLQQNAWYDGRRDVYASTKAATTYLKELSEPSMVIGCLHWHRITVAKAELENPLRKMKSTICLRIIGL